MKVSSLFIVATTLLVVVLAAPFLFVSAQIGGDVSEVFSTSAFSCAKTQLGWSWTCVRAYCSYGNVDPNAPTTLANAKAAGLRTDIYIFPCRSQSPSQIVKDAVTHVGAGSFGRAWMDIETNPSSGCGWSGDKASNCAFIKEMLSACSSLGVSCGVYSSPGEWSTVAGDSCTVGSDAGVPLWYAQYLYSGQKDCSAYPSFGNWKSPLIHQYSDNAGGACGISADGDQFCGSSPQPPPPPSPPSPPGPSGNCYTFYEGLCPGDNSCMCTLGEQCGYAADMKHSNASSSRARNSLGGCSGSCRRIVHDACTGPDSCLKDVGSC